MAPASGGTVLWLINTSAMTTGKRFTHRTKDHSDQRVLDARTRAILHAVSNEPRGRVLEAYLRALGKR